jgi:hypothetical protein
VATVPLAVRSQIIGYVWTRPRRSAPSARARRPASSITSSCGPDGGLGKWHTERRNVRDDYKKIYGEEPDNPGAVSISIDSNDTDSYSESFVGPIVFKRD